MTRRAVTFLPALLILGLGAEPSGVLIASQVMQSVGVPFALVPLVWLTAFTSLVAVTIIGLNFALLG